MGKNYIAKEKEKKRKKIRKKERGINDNKQR